MKVLKKTKAKFWEDLQVGDEFELVYTLNGNYHSAPSIDIYKDGKRIHINNATQLVDNLNKFILIQINEKGMM